MAFEGINMKRFSWILLILGLFSTFLTCDGESLERCPTNLPRNKYLRIHGDKCYRFITTEVGWPHARNSCGRSGGKMITITRRDIQIFVERTLQELWSKNGMWLGAHDRDNEMDWYWETGEKVRSTYQNWDSGQPSCFLPDFFCHEDCGVLRIDDGYKWHDYLCDSDIYKYGYACQYDLLPMPTKPSKPIFQETTKPTTTTTTTSTTTTTTPPTTMKLSTPETTLLKTSYVHTDLFNDGPTTQTGAHLVADNISRENVSLLMKTPDNLVQIESQRLASDESGMKTGGMVGLIVSFVFVFFAGIIIGIFFCRRKYRKRYDESASVGFNNVLYTAAPRVETRVKETNIQAAMGCDGDHSDNELDHRYVDIDEICAAKCQNVDLPPPPPCKTVDTEPNVSCLKENMYETVTSHCEGAELEEKVVGACGEDTPPPPPPCPREIPAQFAPEFLMKDTDVSQAYSNNLYGYMK